ncbi:MULTISPECIES: hypothetical protein [unclassified Lysinibacillus]|uniref:hypothetical protein n=1 Tax=unclassified Lysinibacillus TaxID=2636778 RepID=UPI001482A524|nr:MULTISPECIES: hypothetical protein [unclassified Lysinibacillus]
MMEGKAEMTDKTARATERTVETTESTPKSKQKSIFQYGDDPYFHAILVILRWAVMVE